MRTMVLLTMVFAVSDLAVGRLQSEEPRRLDRDGNPLPEGAIARLGTLTLRGCGDPILYSPGGKYFVATAGPSRSQVAFFDPDSGRRLFELGTSGTGSHLRFSPEGKLLACPVPGSRHNPVWDVDSRRQLFKFEGSQARFSADGSQLITVSYYEKGYFRVLDSKTGQVLEEHSLQAELSWAEVLPCGTKIVYRDRATGQAVVYDWTRKSRVSGFACDEGFGATASPNGKTLALANRQGVRLMDLASGKELANWKQRTDGLVVFSADGRHLAWSGYDEGRGIAYPWVVEIGGGTPRRVGLPTNSFAPPCFTPDGKALVVLEDGGIPVWRDLDTGKDIRSREGHTGRVWDVLPLTDNRHLLSRDQSRWLVWHLRTARLVRRYPDDLPAGESMVARASRLGQAVTVQENSGTLRLRDLVSGRELLRLEGAHGFVGPPVHPAAVSRDGQTAALVSADYQIRVYDLASGRLRLTHHPKAAVWSLDVSDDGRHLSWVTQSRPGGDGPFFLDTQTGKELILSTFRPRWSEGRWAFSGPADGLDLLAGKKLLYGGRLIDRNWPKSVFGIASSPDERWLAVHYSEAPPGSMGEGRLGLWDLATGMPLAHLQPAPGSFRFSPNSRLLATAGRDGTLKLWEIATGHTRLTLTGHLPGEIPALAFLPDGRTLASGGSDGQVMLWDMTGRAPDGIWKHVEHPPARLQELWVLLASTDGVQAHRAVWELIADPAGSVKFLAERLQPIPILDASLVAQCIADLNSPAFAARQRASTDLAKWGEAVLPALRAAVKNPNSLEQARRLQPLLADLERPDLTGARLRGVRAVEVLETINSDAARKVLGSLANGFAAARLTQEAKMALERRSYER